MIRESGAVVSARRLKLAGLLLAQAVLFGCSSQPKQAAIPPVYVEESLLVKIEKRYGPVVAARVKYWQELIESADQRSEEENLRLTNDFFNGARFVNDGDVWGKSDYWATPLEFLIMDAGDCEDFATAKYFTLEKMGVDLNKMRLTHCTAKTINKAHMVVSYYSTPDAVPMILDNIDGEIKSADKREDLIPVYSFNGDNLWLSRTRQKQVKVGTPEKLKLWQEWLARVREEDVPEVAVKQPR